MAKIQVSLQVERVIRLSFEEIVKVFLENRVYYIFWGTFPLSLTLSLPLLYVNIFNNRNQNHCYGGKDPVSLQVERVIRLRCEDIQVTTYFNGSVWTIK